VRKYFFETLSIVLIGGSFVFFYECIRFLARRDYVPRPSSCSSASP